ncbi:uncharacterized protein LOC113316113 [Papaver somniferum]|uniref:uncharacterized protein LOC113316113 n=1 Tax=Papaver somniferum TaxID=3469 RepID=UPI000E6F62A2|nr:uncharacterized protein LOC113316113 [Papaver somniferum]
MTLSPAHEDRRDLNWIPPDINSLKINCDGSFLDTNKTGGLGLIIRNFAGEHQGCKCIFLNRVENAEQAECRSLWEAVQWAKEMKLERVEFELDSKLVADAVNNESFSIDWRIHNMILDIKILFKVFTLWSCSDVPKEKNKVVDILSKLARVERLSSVWLTFPPSNIDAQLQEDTSFVNTHN